MRTANRKRIPLQNCWVYPQSLLGEMVVGVVGVLASTAIGISFSILAGAFLLLLAGARIEVTLSSAGDSQPQVQTYHFVQSSRQSGTSLNIFGTYTSGHE
ncbi:hypothetical protein CCP3SC15_840003 [Gammaproteobacteria bacterium]